MSSLAVYHVSSPDIPNKVLTHFEDIAATLIEQGIHFARWEAAAKIQPGAREEDLIAAYQIQIDGLMTERGYVAVDVVSVSSDHPESDGGLMSTAIARTKYGFSSPVVVCLTCTSAIMSTRFCVRGTT